MTMFDVFKSSAPEHVRYGYGSLKVGETTSVDIGDKDTRFVAKLRCGISSHSQYYGKKFKTKTVEGKLYIHRIL